MRNFYLISRNGWYHYVRRIPSDLYCYFNFSTLRIPLKIKELLLAQGAAGAIDFELTTLCGVLRTNMLDAKLADLLVNKFLLSRLVKIRQRDQRSTSASEARRLQIATEEAAFNAQGLGLGSIESREARAEWLLEEITNHKYDERPNVGMKLARECLNNFRAKRGSALSLSAEERTWLAYKFQDAEIEALEIDREVILRNKRSLQPRIDDLKRKCEAKYMLFVDIVEGFKEHYPTTLKRVHSDALDNCERDCRVLLELVGNVPINEVNRMPTILELQKKLMRYPNRQGGKKCGDDGVFIKPKTANKYLMRMNAILRYASDYEYLARGAVTVPMFPVLENPADERSPYEPEDFARLGDALCNQRLWLRGENRDERFWAILFAVYHGIESQRIYEIEKEFVVFQDGLWRVKCATWKTGKTEARNALDIPIHDDLLQIGFDEWVASLSDGKIFKEKAKDFGQWYNRRDCNQKGYSGFECKYVTDDPLKTLYSTRHSFQGALYEGGVDIKVIKEAVGHTLDKKDQTRSRYTKRSSALRMKPELGAYKPFEPEMVERLRSRANELFRLFKS